MDIVVGLADGGDESVLFCGWWLDFSGIARLQKSAGPANAGQEEESEQKFLHSTASLARVGELNHAPWPTGASTSLVRSRSQSSESTKSKQRKKRKAVMRIGHNVAARCSRYRRKQPTTNKKVTLVTIKEKVVLRFSMDIGNFQKFHRCPDTCDKTSWHALGEELGVVRTVLLRLKKSEVQY